MIRAGLAAGQRPSACLLHDPYAGHRDYDNWMWVPDPGRDTQWTSWDYALSEAVAALDSLLGPSGHPRWLTEDPDVYWDIGEVVDYATQTVAQESKNYKDGVPPELTIYAKNPTKVSGDTWSMEQWLEWSEQRTEVRLDRGAPEGAHPPTPEEFLEMQRARQARIDAKYAEAAED